MSTLYWYRHIFLVLSCLQSLYAEQIPVGISQNCILAYYLQIYISLWQFNIDPFSKEVFDLEYTMHHQIVCTCNSHILNGTYLGLGWLNELGSWIT